MKRLLLALSMLLMLPLIPASNGITRDATTVAACEATDMGNVCNAERSHNQGRLGKAPDHRFRIEVGPVGDIVFTLLTSLIRL